MPQSLRRVICYPPRPLDIAQFGFNDQAHLDQAHVTLAAGAGAKFIRQQWGWNNIENYGTGVLSISTAQQNWLGYCQAAGIKPIINAGFGGPFTTLGNVTIGGGGPIASGTAAGTSIPVTYSGFTIDSHCFIGGTNVGEGGPGPTNKGSYYGSYITSATSNSLTLAAATAKTLNPGDTYAIQRVRYLPASTDSDPSVAAYVRYFLQLAAWVSQYAGGGYVEMWNEDIWPDDFWIDGLGLWYDSPPGGITTSPHGKAAMQQIQAVSLPAGVALLNGMSHKSSAGSVPNVGAAGRNFTHDTIHPYPNADGNPEYGNWSYYASGATANQIPNPAGTPPGNASWSVPHVGDGWNQWEHLNPDEQSGNLRGIEFGQEFMPGGPWTTGMFATECGFADSNDTRQARAIARRVLSLWGVGAPANVFQLDGGGGDTMSVAPDSAPRPSYSALQRISQVLGRMGSNALAAPVPSVVGWPSDEWPLMSVLIAGAAAGHSVLFAWQRTWAGPGGAWSNPASPSTQSVQISLPAVLSVKECFNVVSGAAITASGPVSNALTVPLADDPVAIRFGP